MPGEPWMRAVSLSTYVEVARFVGLEPYALLRKWDLSLDYLDEPETPISASRFWGLIAESASLSGCESFGLLMSEARPFSSLGPLSLLVKHLPNAREIIRTCVACQRRLNSVINISIEDSEGVAVIAVDHLYGFASRYSAEGSVAMLHRIVNGATDGVWQPERVIFRHSAPRDVSNHQRYFRCALSFEAEYDALVCPTEWLDWPNPSADPVLAKYAMQLIELISPPPRNSVLDHCRSAICLLLPTGNATLEKVASNIDVHPRALQRMLEKEGESFANVLTQIRKELAIRYLQSSHHKLTDVALMLGYSTQGSFSRWFEQEFGTSPSRWQAENVGRQATTVAE